MNKFAASALFVSLAVGTISPLAAEEGAQTLKAVPDDTYSVSEVYQQDDQDKKLGVINDVLVDKNGEVRVLIVGVGGLLGVGATDVALPFKALRMKEKEGKRYLVLNTTKEAMEGAASFAYDRDKRQWLPAGKQSQTGSGFEGVWKVEDTDGKPFQITLSADGSAKGDRAGEGLSGTWKEEGEAAVIHWDSGWTTKILKEGGEYKKVAFDKGKPLDGTPSNSSKAQKVER
jgi:hypothetical protein